MMSDFIVEGKMLRSNQEMDTFTAFYLRVLFTGVYEEGCGLSFNIWDTEEMFTLDLKLNDADCYDKKLIQNSRVHGKWEYIGNEINLPDLEKINAIHVLATNNLYEVKVNNIQMSPKVKVDLERFREFRGVSIEQRGSCIEVDLARSYMKKGQSIFVTPIS